MMQPLPMPYHNNNLFSKYYLDTYLITNPEWKGDDHLKAFEEIKKIYFEEEKRLKIYNESQLRLNFFDKIFSVLGFVYEPGEPTQENTFPDYTFFSDQKNRDDAYQNKGTISFFINAIAVGEVKQWNVDLDKITKTEYPVRQIRDYLDSADKKWGILSNGQLWRIYSKSKRRDDCFEIDLPSLIKANDKEAFRFFYYFFRKDAFVPSRDGVAFLDRVLQGSIKYAIEIGKDLKDNVYWAMRRIAEGFIERGSNRLDKKDSITLARVQKNTMILLYRFLFLLYAEGKGLLDLNDQHYQHYYSFDEKKHEIAKTQDGKSDYRYDTNRTALFNEIKDLFNLVNKGSEALGISKEEMCYVPAYNGGLFDPEKYPDLENWLIGDKYLADAIDFLSRSKPKNGQRNFVDYSTLEIRHLGGIYEGLLEYKLKVADSDLVASDSCWVTLEEYNANRKQKKAFGDFKEDDRVSAGHLYLETDKGERKSTGSYYTPDYIVDYIVKNTIGPVVEQKWKDALEKHESCIDAILSINVLDPAMGSGHFLVGSVDFLSQKLLEAVQKDFETGKIADTTPYTSAWARRDIVSHCIYGVDLNELAVELAKVGLWLTTISKDKPLSFLDHRLKQGNSLIGAKMSDLAWYHEGEGNPESKTGQQAIVPPVFVKNILNKISEIEKIGEDNLNDIKRKEQIFHELQNIPEYQKVIQIADLNTSFYFGNKIENLTNRLPSSYYYNLVGSMYNIDAQWGSRSNFSWFKKALKMGKEKSFFHWELEFPEIFFDVGKLRENRGWDAVIGNPPYINIKNQKDDDIVYFQKKFYSAYGRADISVLFIEFSHNCLIENGKFGFITTNKFIYADYGKKIGDLLSNRVEIVEIIDYDDSPVFPDVTAYTCILRTCNNPSNGQNLVTIKEVRSEDPNFVKEATESNENLNQENSYSLIFPIPQNHFKNMRWGDVIDSCRPSKQKFDMQKIEKLKCFVEFIRPGVACGADDVFISNNTNFDEFNIEKELIIPIIYGDEIKRYEVIEPSNLVIFPYVNDDKKLLEINDFPFVKQYFESKKEILANRYCVKKGGKEYYEFHDPSKDTVYNGLKLVVPDISDKNNFSLYSEKIAFKNTVYILKPKEELFNPYALLAVLNSNLLTKIFKGISPSLRGGFRRYKTKFLEKIPIRRISFITSSDRRASLVNEANELYKDDPRLLLAFVDARLAAKPEESDVVHDLLALLAEQMVEMNKEKDMEITKFLNFIETEIGTSIDILSNKTLIQEYYKHDFDNFVEVLEKNQSKLKKGYKPKNRVHHETLKSWYDSSVAILNPLIAKKNSTDILIDFIVYKLYGLTKEEIETIEGKISNSSID